MAKMNKNHAAGILADVPGDKVFWSNDGLIMRNMNDLASALQKMKATTFKYHANAEKNDFSNWINDVMHDQKLAAGIKGCKTKAEATKLARRRIAERGKIAGK